VRDYFLDGDLFYLGKEAQGRFEFVLLETSSTKAIPVFTSQELTQRFSKHHQVLILPKDDPRAREEFFHAVLSAGANEVWVDVARLEPTQRIPTQQALDYILSLKNQSACL
jgi:hypothetical protein